MRNWLRHAGMLAAACWLAACTQAPVPLGRTWAQDVTGAPYGQDFLLTSMDGPQRSLTDYRGKVVVVFFGYTHCPEVCPVTLYDFAQALHALGAQKARQVQVLFVTLDPSRDTPQVLRKFVRAFDPSFEGLYGDAARTAATAAQFHVYFHVGPRDAAGQYFLDHSAYAYAYDRQGRLRLLMPFGEAPDELAHDLRTLLAAG